jgi:DNA-binding CsgD family transcriptional regulator
LSHWCDAQPELVLYRGQCLVHRAEIMLLRGAWADASGEVRRAIERLAQPASQRAIGAAHYLRGELHRLHGEPTAAEEAYRLANRWGHQPQPGLALLRLAQGRVDAAGAAIRRVLDEAEDAFARAPVLAAYVEIVLAGGDVAAGRAAAEDLVGVAAGWESPLLHAQAAQALGAVLLAEGDARGAVGALRRAWAGWRELEAPYDAARVRVLLGLACRALGDEDGAAMELDAARSEFERLGAGPDLGGVEQLARTSPRPAPGGLTARELEVLALVAGGRSNRAIAAELVISERTVATHVSSILAKLGLPSRSAATAYAYRHHLV